MSEDAQNPNQPLGRDSRLESFLRQASAIIAAEKGINNVAQAKLEDLANRLNLPADLFDEGLKRLQDSNSPIGDLTAYERGFQLYLVKEFDRMPDGTVLSISMEDNAIAYAKERFEIPRSRAEQLIEHQTKKSGFGRMSRTDAREFGRQAVIDRIGDRTDLDPKSEKQIYRISRRWGWDQKEVKTLIQQRLSENRRLAKAGRRRPALLASALIVCVASISVAAWWLYENRIQIFGAKVVDLEEVKTADDVTERETEANSKPDHKTALGVLFPEFSQSLSSEQGSLRSDAIVEVADRVLRLSQIEDQHVNALTQWYLAELDSQSTNRFVQTIDQAMVSPPKSERNGQLELPYRATRLAILMCQAMPKGDTDDRRWMPLSQTIKNRTSIDVQAMDFNWNASANSVIATRQWNQLLESVWTSPGRSAILVSPLKKLTQTKLPSKTIDQFVTRAVRTIIQADKTQWRNMQAAIGYSITAADEVQRMEWVDVWLDVYDGTTGFRDFAAPDLLRSFGQSETIRTAETLGFLNQVRTDWRNRKLSPALIRLDRVNEKVTRLRSLADSLRDPDTLPDLIAQSATIGNVYLEIDRIVHSGGIAEPSAWSEVDNQLEQVDRRLRDVVFLEESTGPMADRVSSAGFDTTVRDRALLAFADLSDSNRAKRLAAIDRIPGLVAKFESIPQSMASALATYLLSPIESEEWLQVQRIIPELGKWNRLTLAVSDQLPDSAASIDQTLMTFSLLTGSVWEGKKESKWKDDVSDQLFRHAYESLVLESSPDPNSLSSDWIRLEKHLQSTYFRRCLLFDGNPSTKDRSALGFARQYARLATENPDRAERAFEIIDAATRNDVEKIVLLNHFVLDSQPRGDVVVGVKLLQSELALLQLWKSKTEERLSLLTE